MALFHISCLKEGRQADLLPQMFQEYNILNSDAGTGLSVNTIWTGGEQIIPIYYYWPSQCFSPSGITVLKSSSTELAIAVLYFEDINIAPKT